MPAPSPAAVRPAVPDTCIIGAGWSGLLACKAFLDEGFVPVVLEKKDHIGGVWQHDPRSRQGGVMASTITTSSKGITEMSDFPMPADFPDFPRHSQIMDYLHSYVARFGLAPHIELGVGAARVEKEGDGWRVTGTDGRSWQVARVVVCSGVHQEPTDSGRAELAGFTGRVLHSVEARACLDELADQRVLIIGAGETASDLAGELTRRTPHLAVSSRRGQWFTNRSSNVPLPVPSLNDYFSSSLRWVMDPTDSAQFAAAGVIERYGACGSGVPEWQTERPFQGAFLNKNATLVDLWRLGQVRARRGVASASGPRVRFVDGREEDFDVVVLCTGFVTVFPFLPAPYATRPVDHHLKLCLADDPTLSFVGFARPLVGSIPGIAELQARCVAALAAGRIATPTHAARTVAEDQAYARRRFADARIPGLVDMNRYVEELAVWLGVWPRWSAVFRRSPALWWSAVNAPHNGALFRINEALDAGDDPALARLVAHVSAPRYLFKKNLAAWAHVLIRNLAPVRARSRARGEGGGLSSRRLDGQEHRAACCMPGQGLV